MQRFVPFEDQWDLLESMGFAGLVPYRLGTPCEHQLGSNVIEFEIIRSEPAPLCETADYRLAAAG
jgi:hypothetical protein